MVITGRNEASRHAGNTAPYQLSEEVQRVLIEDFLPPIGSSTVVGNPGRIYIDLDHL